MIAIQASSAPRKIRSYRPPGACLWLGMAEQQVSAAAALRLLRRGPAPIGKLGAADSARGRAARLPEPPDGGRKVVKVALTRDQRQGYLDDMTDPRVAPLGAGRLQTLCCSFCSKDKDAVAQLIAGPGVHICDECVASCNRILADKPDPEFGAWAERPDDEMLVSLARIQGVVSQVDAAVHDHVAMLRDRGISWTRIGEALGVSKQAAWERFSGED